MKTLDNNQVRVYLEYMENGWRQTHSGWHGPAARAKFAREDAEYRRERAADLRSLAAEYEELGKTERAAALRTQADVLEANLS